MNKRIINICQILFKISKGAISGIGIAILLILTLGSLVKLLNINDNPKFYLDWAFDSFYLYFWIPIFVIYFTGLIIKWLHKKSKETLYPPKLK